MRRLLATLAATTAALLCGAGAAGAAGWTPVPLPPPPGGQFSVPAGFVGDLSFWAPNRGLMTVGGNNSVKPGLYSWDGESWHQLSTVCGGGPNAKIAWAGPREFWTITAPAVGTQPNGLGLCRYKDGAVVGSYSFYNVPDFVPSVNAATCRTADDCWFGGVGATSVDGRAGAFHLHWDGSTLASVYNGQGRGVSDLVTHRGAILESTFVGTGPGAQGTRPFLGTAEPVPALLHRIDAGVFRNDAFSVAPFDGGRADGAELRSLDTDGTTAWAVGGAANSGPGTAEGFTPRPPVAARKDGDGAWQELALRGDDLPSTRWFGSVAAVPGTREAWATLADTEVAGPTPSGETSAPTVARIAADGTVVPEQLDAREGGAARGAATAIACPATDDCWVATARGYLYRRTSGATYPRDTDPAFQGTIAIRPNEAASQVIPDEPPADDSRLLAPPVVLPPPAAAAVPTACAAPPALISRVKAGRKPLSKKEARKKNARITLVIAFRLARPATVGVIAKRGSKTVGRAKARTLKPGTRRLTVAVRRRTFPKKISFSLKELTTPACVPEGDGIGGDDTTVTRSAVRRTTQASVTLTSSGAARPVLPASTR
ncbi:hypothetical protein [Patulibacter sp.]|uniref:hypothetical protein n=1 Tax=Patulibacter sp. TaxID=1912859 RepID=UPI0027163E8C|nr:hypothetical protein [Patulibacter sp.]MDO9409965.1 hypothetical protein [Patulibacter sp.]